MIRILKYGEVSNQDVFARAVPEMDVTAVVADIIENVRSNGDAALLAYDEKFEKVKLDSLRVTQQEIDEAFASVGEEFLGILERAAANIREFHSKQVREGFRLEKEGRILGQKVMPIEKVGLCVPGGVTPLSSTVLMDAIPAKIAGCKELVMVTPPQSSGRIDPSILAAAKIAGVDEIFKIGGAQAVAALAYGTESVPKVDKIVGPGGAFVAEAKRQVFGRVSIDMIAGPSEILVVADGKSNPRCIAADMLSQAEHDKLAAAVLVTDDLGFAEKVQAEIEEQLKLLIREEIARASIENNGKIIVTDNLETAIDVANEIAPEHLELSVDDPFAYLDKIKNAGSVFLGRNCPEALGDYYAGANHTLPTSGAARFSSPLSVDDFVKKTQFIYYDEKALLDATDDVDAFAKTEGLTGHARSVTIRREEYRK